MSLLAAFKPGAAPLDLAALRSWAGDKLPKYQLPTRWVTAQCAVAAPLCS